MNNGSFVIFKCLLVLYQSGAYSEIAAIAVMNMFKHEYEKRLLTMVRSCEVMH